MCLQSLNDMKPIFFGSSVTYKFRFEKEVNPMEVIKNGKGKTVCRADGSSKSVEIIHKHYKTTITFLSNGKYTITNTKI